jgi:perosamine synthetase
MTNICAAIGLAQLERVSETIARKRDIARLYKTKLEHTSGLVAQGEETWAFNVYWMFSILVSPEKRDALRRHLEDRGVETRPFFYPAHMMPIYGDYGHQRFPVAERISASGINLPSAPTLTDDEIERICGDISSFLGKL